MLANRTAAPPDEHPLRCELRRATPLLLAIPLIVGVVWLAGILVMHSRVDQWDLSVDRWLASHRTGSMNVVTEWATWLAETVPVVIILFVAIVVARRQTGEWRTSVCIALAVGGEKLVYLISSTLVARDRPPVATLDDTYATSSFPSGHVGAAITLYASIAIVVGARHGRKWLIALMAVMVLIACMVGFSRMYRGFHYPSDIAFGALVGGAWMWLTVHVFHPLQPG